MQGLDQPRNTGQAACRHRTNRNMLLAKVMLKQPWADGPSVKAELDRQVDALLGPKTEADDQPLPKAKPAKKVWLALNTLALAQQRQQLARRSQPYLDLALSCCPAAMRASMLDGLRPIQSATLHGQARTLLHAHAPVLRPGL